MDDDARLLGAALWRADWLDAREYAEAAAAPGGERLTGVVLLPIGGRPGRIGYRVETGPDGTTRSASVEISSGGEPWRLELRADGAGGWIRDGLPAPELTGCADVDLGFSPVTNTLPIRRLSGAAEGEEHPVAAAWLRYPELVVERLDQTYTRLGPETWRYRAPSLAFEALLATDPVGLVRRYGELWGRVDGS
ncbi:putative glycolipid-binding domain-containing protein [Allonocardiopsis opalescens]|uniref:Glycolipid-binding protein n=1 Tax=Allonocardiopsis opalescens TaxID=1144618 RepID=A0A2T0QD79_9ACTN|nr:putative glycolipid-binding domain-containing protein [Allonocardiopsis opalescens]PRY01887.1 hypothetical protein CLV72_101485 [Allonocardiopsis opalescens]